MGWGKGMGEVGRLVVVGGGGGGSLFVFEAARGAGGDGALSALPVPATTACGPGRADCGPGRADCEPGRADCGPGRADCGPGRADSAWGGAGGRLGLGRRLTAAVKAVGGARFTGQDRLCVCVFVCVCVWVGGWVCVCCDRGCEGDPDR
jgi:hypothetical protein